MLANEDITVALPALSTNTLSVFTIVYNAIILPIVGWNTLQLFVLFVRAFCHHDDALTSTSLHAVGLACGNMDVSHYQPCNYVLLADVLQAEGATVCTVMFNVFMDLTGNLCMRKIAVP